MRPSHWRICASIDGWRPGRKRSRTSAINSTTFATSPSAKAASTASMSASLIHTGKDSSMQARSVAPAVASARV